MVAFDTAHGPVSAEDEDRMREEGVPPRPPRGELRDRVVEEGMGFLARFPAAARADVFFVALHGGPGEDGRIQGVLDLAGVAYTGSGALACRAAMNKEVTKQLLVEAGYPGGRGLPPVELLAPGGFRAQAPHLQAQWRQNLGVEVHFQVLPWAEFIDRFRNAPPHLTLMAWEPDYPDPDSYLRVAVQRHTAWRQERYLFLVERARRSLDLAERMALYAQAELILVEQVPLLPLSYPRVHLLVKPWIRSSPRSATGAFSLKDVVIEPH